MLLWFVVACPKHSFVMYLRGERVTASLRQLEGAEAARVIARIPSRSPSRVAAYVVTVANHSFEAQRVVGAEGASCRVVVDSSGVRGNLPPFGRHEIYVLASPDLSPSEVRARLRIYTTIPGHFVVIP